MFQPKRTMYNFDLRDEAKVNGSIHSRVIRTLLTNNIGYLTPSLQEIVSSTLQREVGGDFGKLDRM